MWQDMPLLQPGDPTAALRGLLGKHHALAHLMWTAHALCNLWYLAGATLLEPITHCICATQQAGTSPAPEAGTSPSTHSVTVPATPARSCFSCPRVPRSPCLPLAQPACRWPACRLVLPPAAAAAACSPPPTASPSSQTSACRNNSRKRVVQVSMGGRIPAGAADMHIHTISWRCTSWHTNSPTGTNLAGLHPGSTHPACIAPEVLVVLIAA